MTNSVDVLLLTALPEEFEEARKVFTTDSSGNGVLRWDEQKYSNTPYHKGTYSSGNENLFDIAIAHPGRMGGIGIALLATTLIERLKPQCLVMSGVCAGNPGDLALGDLVVSEMAYQYDEGKRTPDKFLGDHRHSIISVGWRQAAEQLKASDLPSHGEPTDRMAKYWLLETLMAGDDPRSHPARDRYFGSEQWKRTIESLEEEKLVILVGKNMDLSEAGRQFIERSRYLDIAPPDKLPVAIRIGPIASGNTVVKDGVTWENLKQMGVRTVLGLEMEAATIGAAATALGVAEWLVVKGVMDHADPRKDDRYKLFAARASAEALRLFLERNPPTKDRALEASGSPPLPMRIRWVPGSVDSPFFEALSESIEQNAPDFFGLLAQAARSAEKAYKHAKDANTIAMAIRKHLGAAIMDAHSSDFLDEKKIALAAGKSATGRELIAEIWDSGDEFLGESLGREANGLGEARVYMVSKWFTPDSTAKYAGQWEDGRYGEYGVFYFSDSSHFSGLWKNGHPTLGYREYAGRNEKLGCDFFVGEMARKHESEEFTPVWLPHGKGICVDVSRREALCGSFDSGESYWRRKLAVLSRAVVKMAAPWAAAIAAPSRRFLVTSASFRDAEGRDRSARSSRCRSGTCAGRSGRGSS
ncbi:MAG: hypothetical protein R3D85_03955 [Paracoccaceae bacterium]